MRVILLILFILLIGQIVVNFFFVIKRLGKYELSFIKDLHRKMIEKFNFIITEIFQEFEELFEKYKDGEFSFSIGAFEAFFSLIIMFAADAFLLIGVLLQTCRDCLKICSGVLSLI